MRLVRRRATRKPYHPTPPWERREQWQRGTPRTCLTNLQRPIIVQRGDMGVRTGVVDPLLRLYQHPISGALVDGVKYVAYLPTEWEEIQDWCDWIEALDESREVVYRIGMTEALLGGRFVDTPQGRRMALPLSIYQVYEGE